MTRSLVYYLCLVTAYTRGWQGVTDILELLLPDIVYHNKTVLMYLCIVPYFDGS
jgi:hypothetical protein